ncbi:MAG TPA: SbmA/BacA-like family transporter [Bryobacteraceae bacterium]|jgi:putative ATP-binding cassette transporter
MSEQAVAFDRVTGRRFVRAIKDFLNSEVRWHARGLFALLIAFALTVNGLNVVNSYVGRDFMTAIAHRDMAGFIREAILYIGVFAITTAVAVFYRFTEERLGLFWRVWLTRRIIRRYLADRTYLHLKESATIENPDQRIAEDVRAFTTTTLSFTLMFMNGALAVLSFSGVLWTISPLLFGVAIGYAVFGTLATIYLGRPLIGLNYRQSDQEASFRSDLIHVRENAEPVALLRREGRLTARLLRRIDGFADNFRRITSVNRNVGFFTTGYNYLLQIIPTLIAAPLFIRGKVEFGVITQSAMAFAQLLGAFSLIVNQFQSISLFAAVIARLSALVGAVEKGPPSARTTVAVVEADGPIAYKGLTLFSPESGREVLKNLTADIPRGTRVLIVGPNEAARVALFRATAGIWTAGDGTLVRPQLDAIFFLPQQPYVPPGTLRDLLLRTGREQVITDEQITTALRDAGLGFVQARAGGLDTERDWSATLSLGEQQLLALTRLILARPDFAMLDRVNATLKPAQVREALQRLEENAITYITLAEDAESVELYDAVLDIDADGAWSWKPTGRYTSA